MKKAFNICWKDLIITLHDRAALLFMLLAPFLLTLGMGLVTGSFSSSGGGTLQDIPVSIINLDDDGLLSNFVVEAFRSDSLAVLLEPTFDQDVAEARQAVDTDQSAAAVIIPAGFSNSIMPAGSEGAAGEAVQIEIYANPARPNSVMIVRSVLAEVINGLDTYSAGGLVTIAQQLSSGRLSQDEINDYAQGMGERMAEQGAAAESLVRLNVNQPEAQPEQNNYLSYLAPGMAVVFLMYTATQGGRSILAERQSGTLARLLATPSGVIEVLGGKVLGIFVTGLAQMVVLVAASALLFGLNWGSPLAVGALLVATVAASTGWGILLASVAKTPWQVSSLGSAMMLLFGMVGGSFVPLQNVAPIVRTISKVTPNAWTINGFTTLADGGTLADLTEPILWLLGMAGLLFGLSILFARRRWASGFVK